MFKTAQNIAKYFSKDMLELKESQTIIGEQLNRTQAMLNKSIIKLEKVGKQLADQGLVQGEVAEELFYRDVKGFFRPLDLLFSGGLCHRGWSI